MKCKKEIHSEIPQRYNADGNCFRQVEIPFQFIGKNPDYEIV
jgi:hypothetical protein